MHVVYLCDCIIYVNIGLWNVLCDSMLYRLHLAFTVIAFIKIILFFFKYSRIQYTFLVLFTTKLIPLLIFFGNVYYST